MQEAQLMWLLVVKRGCMTVPGVAHGGKALEKM